MVLQQTSTLWKKSTDQIKHSALQGVHYPNRHTCYNPTTLTTGPPATHTVDKYVKYSVLNRTLILEESTYLNPLYFVTFSFSSVTGAIYMGIEGLKTLLLLRIPCVE